MKIHMVKSVNNSGKFFKATSECGLTIDERSVGKERLITTEEKYITCPICLYEIGKISYSEFERCCKNSDK